MNYKYIAKLIGDRMRVVDNDGKVYPTDDTADWVTEGMMFDEDDIEGYMWGGNEDQLGFLVLKYKS